MTVRRDRLRIDQVTRYPSTGVGAWLQVTGLKIESRAKVLCPVDTGRLRASIRTTRPTITGEHTMTVRIGSNVNYARYVEEGTRYMRPRRYLRRALEQELA